MTPEQFNAAQSLIDVMNSRYSLPSTQAEIASSTDQQYRLALHQYDSKQLDSNAKPISQSKQLIIASALKRRAAERISRITIDTDGNAASAELKSIMYDLEQVLLMRKGLFEKWMEAELATGKSVTNIIGDLNTACGTLYANDWTGNMKKLGYKTNLLPSAVVKYMKSKVATQPATPSDESQQEKLIRRLAKLEKRCPYWRRELDAYMNTSKYRDHYVIQRITGCRTEELTTGVRVEEADDGHYLLHIVTAKGRAKNGESNDDRIRIIKSNNPMLDNLTGKTVRLDNKLSYRTNLARMTLRRFGIELSPYSLRYSLTSDMKHAGYTSVQRAEFLGHSSLKVVGRYSRGMNTGSSGREPVAKLEKARIEVKPSSPPTQRHIAEGCLKQFTIQVR